MGPFPFANVFDRTLQWGKVNVIDYIRVLSNPSASDAEVGLVFSLTRVLAGADREAVRTRRIHDPGRGARTGPASLERPDRGRSQATGGISCRSLCRPAELPHRSAAVRTRPDALASPTRARLAHGSHPPRRPCLEILRTHRGPERYLARPDAGRGSRGHRRERRRQIDPDAHPVGSPAAHQGNTLFSRAGEAFHRARGGRARRYRAGPPGNSPGRGPDRRPEPVPRSRNPALRLRGRRLDAREDAHHPVRTRR